MGCLWLVIAGKRHYSLGDDDMRVTDRMNRIYKPKYDDDTSKPKALEQEQKGVDASLSSLSKEIQESKVRPSGRARSRSFWGRSKKN